MAYKKDVDDLRESPTLKIMQLLQQRGAEFDYNDPYFPQLHKMRHYNYEGMKSVPINPQTLASYDGVVIATDHTSYDYAAIVDCCQAGRRHPQRHPPRHAPPRQNRPLLTVFIAPFDLGNQLTQEVQTGHSDRSGAAFSSSFAPANEPRCEVEESLFD